MGDYVYTVTKVFQLGVFFIASYYLILSLFGLYRKSTMKVHRPKKTFALIVAAHNEEVVIGKSVESLMHLEYPKELYDVFVIADNCTDKTAEISRNHGAKVFERTNKEKRGKGYALEWMFDKIFKMEKNYDAVAIFDADNLVSPNFLSEMNNYMCEGYKVVQGYIDSKNPDDSWITQSYSLAFWSANRLFQLSRSNLGLSNQIGGTGFVVNTDILKKLGWGATCLTEDLEFTCKMVLNGHKVGWAHDAIVYDEKPLTLKDSWKQRKRWMQGFADVASRFFKRLIKKAFRDRDIVAFDCALFIMQPFVVILLFIAAVLSAIQANSPNGFGMYDISKVFGGSNIIWKLFSLVQFLLISIAITADKKYSKKFFTVIFIYSLNIFFMESVIKSFGFPTTALVNTVAHCAYTIVCFLIAYLLVGKAGVKKFWWNILYVLYTLSWIPITIQGIIDKDKKEWSHTKHVRQIGIYDV